MSEAFHEYDFPDDRSVHWCGLSEELRDGAKTTEVSEDITCAGCRGWLEARGVSVLARVGGPTVFLACTHPPGSRTCSVCTLDDADETSPQAVAARVLKTRRYTEERDELIATREALLRLYKATEAYFEHHGAEHETGCPEDDTCECPLVNAVNEAFAAALPLVEKLETP